MAASGFMSNFLGSAVPKVFGGQQSSGAQPSGSNTGMMGSAADLVNSAEPSGSTSSSAKAKPEDEDEDQASAAAKALYSSSTTSSSQTLLGS